MKCPHCKKQIDDELINRHFASKGGKGNKGKERPDMKPGGKTYEKRWGKAKKV
jgi:hypothetical protein